MNDLVSIIMPSYNTARFIKDSIDSVLNQTYRNWELIIIDDCSTDESISIIKNINDKRIILLENQENSGAAVSRNYGLRKANGKYIAFLDSDDLWLPEKLENQIRFMESNNYVFTYTCYEQISEENRELGIYCSGPKIITRKKMFRFCYPGCLTVVYDRTAVGDLQIADIKKNNDYAMWLSICKNHNCYLLNENLAKYRKGRTGSISSHGFLTLIKWHYKLFKEVEKENWVVAIYHTLNNLFFGALKKIFYTKKIRQKHE